MNEATSIIDALYKNFLLRDLFAKIVPGIILGASACTLSGMSTELMSLLAQLGWPSIFLAAGFSWTLGYAVQQFGETLKIIRHFPKRYKNDNIRYSLRRNFDKLASDDEAQQVERYAVIKEACGNCATALILALSVAAYQKSGEFTSLLATGNYHHIAAQLVPALVWLVIAALLIRANRSHANKHYKYMATVVEVKQAE